MYQKKFITIKQGGGVPRCWAPKMLLLLRNNVWTSWWSWKLPKKQVSSSFLLITPKYDLRSMRFSVHKLLRVLLSLCINFSLIRRHTFSQFHLPFFHLKVGIAAKPNLGSPWIFFSLKANGKGFLNWCGTPPNSFSFRSYVHLKSTLSKLIYQ